MLIGTLDDRAARILAGAVVMWRGHGASDEELAAAGSRGVAEALDEHRRASDGLSFELRCVHAVTSAICDALPRRAVLCPGDLESEARTRAALIRRNLFAVRQRYLETIGRSGHGLSTHSLAVFSLFDERSATIRASIHELLAADDTALSVAPPNDDGDIEYTVHALELPAAGTRWSIVLSFDASDSCAHFDLDGWTVLGIGWTH